MFTFNESNTEKSFLLIGMEEEIFINVVLSDMFISNVNYSIIKKEDKEAISKGLKKINCFKFYNDRGYGLMMYDIIKYINKPENRELFYDVDLVMFQSKLIECREEIRYNIENYIELLSFFKRRKYIKKYKEHYGK